MGNEFVSCSFLLLLLVTLAHGITSDGVNVLRLPSEDLAKPTLGGHMGMGVDVTDPWSKAFAVMKDFEIGTTRPIYFPYVEDPTSLEFLPKEKTQNIPFSTKALPELLQFFSLSPDSPQALSMKKALEYCETTPAQEGEINHCATSSESLADFAHRVYGPDKSEFIILRSSRVSKSTPIVQNYTVVKSKEISTGKIIACHYQAYPYALYYCHVEMNSMNKVFMLSLIGENGDKVNGPFLCHMNTTQWDADNNAFRVLRVKPGDSEVCHSLPAHDLVVLPK